LPLFFSSNPPIELLISIEETIWNSSTIGTD
jgi:hypothetical protein